PVILLLFIAGNVCSQRTYRLVYTRQVGYTLPYTINRKVQKRLFPFLYNLIFNDPLSYFLFRRTNGKQNKTIDPVTSEFKQHSCYLRRYSIPAFKIYHPSYELHLLVKEFAESKNRVTLPRNIPVIARETWNKRPLNAM
ncbi:MAG: hypothetical protein ABIO04_00815, partial [Ferruginibacter sp.]